MPSHSNRRADNYTVLRWRWLWQFGLVLAGLALLTGGATGAGSEPDGYYHAWEPFDAPEGIELDFGPPLTPYAYRARGAANLPAVPVKPPTTVVVTPLPPTEAEGAEGAATVAKNLPVPRFDSGGQPALSLAYPAAGSQVGEGVATFVWHTSGPIARVKLTYHGERCRLGGSPRGSFSGALATVKNSGSARVPMPWLDGINFTLRLTGFDDSGRVVASTEARYELLPQICRGKGAQALVISKSRQRLYYLRAGRIVRMHVISTGARGYGTPNMGPGSSDRRRGAMGKVFYKAPAPVSRLYRVVMRYYLAITSSGSHGIHATSANFYRRLGSPASHGCIRQHLADARTLYQLVPVGTAVYVR